MLKIYAVLEDMSVKEVSKLTKDDKLKTELNWFENKKIAEKNGGRLMTLQESWDLCEGKFKELIMEPYWIWCAEHKGNSSVRSGWYTVDGSFYASTLGPSYWTSNGRAVFVKGDK